jgi:sensor histidine kinase regulating citrate/malate metabolism
MQCGVVRLFLIFIAPITVPTQLTSTSCVEQSGNTALAWAAKLAYADVVRLLINARADKEIQNRVRENFSVSFTVVTTA